MHARPALRLAFALGVITLLGSCESIIGADFGAARRRPPLREVDGSSTPPRDASVDARKESGTPTCSPLAAPPRRTGVVRATDQVEFTVVLSSVDFGDHAPDGGTPEYLTKGYDLDGLCTDPGASSCSPQPWIGSVPPDGPRGQDNGIGRLILAQLTTFGVQAVGSDVDNAAVARGDEAPTGLLRVRGFGGLSEDDRVEVDWFVPAPPLGSGDAGTPPAFDATDHWPVLSTTVSDATVAAASATLSLYRDDSAFVEKNMLVAHFDHVIIPLRNNYFDVYGLVLTGVPSRDSRTGIWSIENGTISGHAHVQDLLGVIPAIAFRIFGVRLCTDNTQNYPGVKRFICASADLPSSTAGPGSPCEDSSVGLTFETAAATLGGLVLLPPPETLCPAGTSPGEDSCAIPPPGG